MAGSITVSSITLDSDNNFSIRSNTGATLFSANGSGIVSGVQNTAISGVITNAQLAGLITGDKIGQNAISSNNIVSVNVSVASVGTLPKARLPAGSILQVVQATKTDTFSAADTGSYVDITGLSLSITPSSATSRILIMVSMGICTSFGSGRERTSAFRIYRNSTSVLEGTPSESRSGSLFRRGDNNTDSNHSSGASFQVVDSPNTTSSITYKLSVEVEGGATFYVNRSPNDENDGDSYGTRTASTIIAMEIAA